MTMTDVSATLAEVTVQLKSKVSLRFLSGNTTMRLAGLEPGQIKPDPSVLTVIPFVSQVEVTKFGIDKKNMFAFWDVSTTVNVHAFRGKTFIIIHKPILEVFVVRMKNCLKI